MRGGAVAAWAPALGVPSDPSPARDGMHRVAGVLRPQSPWFDLLQRYMTQAMLPTCQ